MTQLINIAIGLLIVAEILYMFTCGQDYVRANIKRARRIFWIDRMIFMLIGVLALVSSFVVKNPDELTVAFNLSIAMYFGRKCLSVYKYRDLLTTKNR